jgi:hypothetical protein
VPSGCHGFGPASAEEDLLQRESPDLAGPPQQDALDTPFCADRVGASSWRSRVWAARRKPRPGRRCAPPGRRPSGRIEKELDMRRSTAGALRRCATKAAGGPAAAADALEQLPCNREHALLTTTPWWTYDPGSWPRRRPKKPRFRSSSSRQPAGALTDSLAARAVQAQRPSRGVGRIRASHGRCAVGDPHDPADPNGEASLVHYR